MSPLDAYYKICEVYFMCEWLYSDVKEEDRKEYLEALEVIEKQVKGGDWMKNTLDELIATTAGQLDCLMALRDIVSTGDCNICNKKNECAYVPKPGQIVRYNCPFYEERNKLHRQTG